MKKKDIILLLSVFMIALSFFLIGKLIGREEGTMVVITVNGEVYGTYDLSEDQEIVIDNEYGCNTVCIKSGKVYMEDADCPDKYCQKQGKISANGAVLVCLPHKLVVKVQAGDSENTKDASDDADEPDAFSK